MNEPMQYRNPFPGLRSFEPDEVELFFGRDQQVDELLNRLQKSCFLAVLGTSGSGKSSLVRAGLIPALQGGFMTDAGSTWRVAICKPGNDPIGNLARALNKPDVLGFDTTADFSDAQSMIIEATLRNCNKGLIDAVQQAKLGDDENLLILIDQFEELFRFRQTRQDVRRRGDAVRFSQLLINAAHEKSVAIYVVLTMRSDFVGDCSEIPRLAETINDGMYLIPRMTREEQRAVITGPVAVGGAEVAPRLVMQLLNSVGDSQDMLPVLQHVLMRTWDYWKAHQNDDQPIDLEHYQAVGGLENALDLHAEEAFLEMADPRQQGIVELMFKRLTHLGKDQRGVRRPTRIQEVCEITGASLDEVTRVVECFRKPGRSFLMPLPEVALTEDTVLDISHESLMRVWKRLIRWVHEESESAKQYIELAETAAEHQDGKKGLLKNPELQLFLQWQERFRPTEAWAQRYDPSFARAQLYLKTSADAHNRQIALEKKRQKQKILRAYSISAILVVILVVILFLVAKYLNLLQISKMKDEVIQGQEQQIQEKRKEVEQIEKELTGIQLQIDSTREQAKEYERYVLNAREKLRQARLAQTAAESSRVLIEKELALSEITNLARQVEIDLKNTKLGELTVKEDRLNAKIDSTTRLSLAERLAIQAPKMNLPEQQMLFTGQAYHLHIQNGGSELEPTMYQALKRVLEQNNERLVPLNVHQSDVRALVFLPGVSKIQLATAGEDQMIRLWQFDADENSLEALAVLKHPFSDKFRTVSVSAHYMLAAGDQSGVILVWDLNDSKRKSKILTNKGVLINSLRFNETGQYLAASTINGSVEIWECKNRNPEEAQNFRKDFKTRIAAVVFIPGQRKIIAGGDAGQIYIWDWHDSNYESRPLYKKERILSLAVSPDGQRVAVGKTDGQIEVHPISFAKAPVILNSHTAGVTSLEFHPTDPVLVSGSFDKTIRIWDLENPERESIVLGDHEGWIWAVAFSPDGKRILSTSSDQTLRFWYPNTALLAQRLGQKIQNSLTQADWRAFKKQWLKVVGSEILPDSLSIFYPKNEWAGGN